MSETEDRLSATLQTMVEEVSSTRLRISSQVSDLTPDSTPNDLLAVLMEARKAQDRVEGILSRLTLLHSRAAAMAQAAVDEKQDRWTEAATSQLRSAAQAEPAPRERYAAYDMQVIKQTMEMRRRSSAAAEIEATLACARGVHRGLDNTRQDLSTILRAKSVADRLES